MLTEEMIIARTRISNLEAVTKLNCWGSELSDVSILRKMKNVTVLSLSVNNLDSLEVFQFCTKLQELFVRKNNISDLNQVCYLQGLPELRSLLLKDNPCVANEEEYRLAVIRALPQLKKLDDAPVESSEIEKAQRLGRTLIHPDQQQEYYSESDEEEYSYSGQQNNRELPERSPSPEVVEYRRERNRTPPTPEPTNGQYQRSREFNNSFEQVNDQQTYNNDSADPRDIYNEPPVHVNQNHRQPAPVYKQYEEETTVQRQQNHRPQGMLPRSRTTDGELGHYSCPTCCRIPQQTHRRPMERRTNVLSAVLCLIKELDYPNLEVVQMEVKCRMEELCNDL